MKLTNIKLFSQNDSRWKTNKLGTSTICTIGSDGCLITCATIMCNYFGKEITPDQLNISLTRVKGYVDGCRLIYGAITDIFSDIKVDWDMFIDCSNTPAPLDKIDATLFSKRPVIVKVDYDIQTSKINEHWIIIVGKTEDGSYICVDPIDGSEIFFQARYGDPSRYIFKIVAYSGQIPTNTNAEDTIGDLQDKVKSLNETIATLSLENNQLRTDLVEQEKDNEDLGEQLNKARTERDKATWEMEQMQIKSKRDAEEIQELKKRVDTQLSEIKTLKIDLAKAQDTNLEDFSGWTLLFKGISKLIGGGK